MISGHSIISTHDNQLSLLLDCNSVLWSQLILLSSWPRPTSRLISSSIVSLLLVHTLTHLFSIWVTFYFFHPQLTIATLMAITALQDCVNLLCCSSTSRLVTHHPWRLGHINRRYLWVHLTRLLMQPRVLPIFGLLLHTSTHITI
jgi:hypothetical protein